MKNYNAEYITFDADWSNPFVPAPNINKQLQKDYKSVQSRGIWYM